MNKVFNTERMGRLRLLGDRRQKDTEEDQYSDRGYMQEW